MSLLAILTRTALGLAPAVGLAPAPAAPSSRAPAHIAASAPLLAAAGVPSAPTEIVDRVQQFYAGIKQVTASFRQAVTNSTFGSTKTSDGTVWIMKPGKMRWDYLEKKKDPANPGKDVVEVRKSFISNGTYLYVIEHDNKQVVKKSLQQDLMPVAVSFLYGKGDLRAEFNAELDKTGKYGEKDDVVLRLTPKQPSAQYKNLYLVVSPKDFHVSQSVIVDSSGNVNHFRFYAPDFEKPVKDSYFEFDERSVKNYRVIDADSSKNGLAGAGGLVPPPPPPPAKPPATKP
ncbi:MAG TPA: outer membrane lipoprotein carrier protein LolA [Kofleriaceae bacterium]|jgi:outer membrane lipoprotein carrier protein|nr:outer membrane lipoprotein carrier protein LolA [Kofleriaceae bacterium]